MCFENNNQKAYYGPLPLEYERTTQIIKGAVLPNGVLSLSPDFSKGFSMVLLHIKGRSGDGLTVFFKFDNYSKIKFKSTPHNLLTCAIMKLAFKGPMDLETGCGWVGFGVISEELTGLLIEKQTGDSSATASSSEIFLVIAPNLRMMSWKISVIRQGYLAIS